MSLMTSELPDIPAALTAVDPNRLEVMGQTITLSRIDASRLSFDLEAPAGTGVPLHTHDHEDEMFLIRTGKVRFVLGDREVIAGPGETVFAPRDVPHAWFVHGEETVDAIVTIVPGNLEQMFRELGAMPKGPPDFERISAICAAAGVRFL